jgi:hypothetical protein
MSVEAQLADGSYAGIRERDGLEEWRAGGYATPAPTSTSSVSTIPAHQPGYLGGSTLHFNVGSDTSSNDSGGGKLLCWQNLKGFDVIVTGHVIDVSTGSASACSASFGKSTTSTGTSSNMIATQSVTTIGVFNGGALSVRVNQNEFITGTIVAGTSSALRARAYFSYLPAPAVGSG